MSTPPFQQQSIPPEAENWLEGLLEPLFPLLQDLGVVLVQIRNVLQTPARTPLLPTNPVLDPRPAVPITRVPRRTGVIAQALGSPEVARPDLSLSSSTFPEPVLGIDPQEQVAVRPGLGVLSPNAFKVEAPGIFWVSGSLLQAAELTFTRDGGNTYALLNKGGGQLPGAEYSYPMLVFPGDEVDVSVSAPATVQYLRLAFVASL